MKTQVTTTNAVTVEAPANIALLKYWGKDDAAQQWPSNDSISMTLTHCRTITTVQVKDGNDLVYLHGEKLTPSGRHGAKIYTQLEFLRKHCGVSDALRVETHNTFPLACGIASSASGMAALTIAAIASWTRCYSWTALAAAGWTRKRLAMLARHGSGSACRSLWGGLVHWQRGAAPDRQHVYQLEDENYLPLCDIIVTPAATTKAVSSSEGHAQAHSSPLFALRIAGLGERRRYLLEALALRDLERIGCLLEQEALEFYQVMASSEPPLVYAGQEALAFMAWLRHGRQRGSFMAYFTIDAGNSVHVLCAAAEVEKITALIHNTYPQYNLIADRIGCGPRLCGATQ